MQKSYVSVDILMQKDLHTSQELQGSLTDIALVGLLSAEQDHY